jgi:uncharacterized membrane protein
MYILVGLSGVLFSTSIAMVCKQGSYSLAKSFFTGIGMGLLFCLVLIAFLTMYQNMDGVGTNIEAHYDNIPLIAIYALLCGVQCSLESRRSH